MTYAYSDRLTEAIMTQSDSRLFLLAPSTREQLQTVFVDFLLRSVSRFPNCAIPLASSCRVRCLIVTPGSSSVTFVTFKQWTCLRSRPLLPSASDLFSCRQPLQHVVSSAVTAVARRSVPKLSAGVASVPLTSRLLHASPGRHPFAILGGLSGLVSGP